MPPRSAPHSAHHARPGPQCTPALRSDPPPGLPRTLWPDSFLESPHGALTLAPRGAHSCISWCTGPLRGGSCWPCPFPPLHTQPLRRAPGLPPLAPSQPPAWTPTHWDSQCPTPERPPSACSGHGEAQPSGHTPCHANEEAARPGCSRVRAEPAVAVTGTRWPQRWRGPHTATVPPGGLWQEACLQLPGHKWRLAVPAPWAADSCCPLWPAYARPPGSRQPGPVWNGVGNVLWSPVPIPLAPGTVPGPPGRGTGVRR